MQQQTTDQPRHTLMNNEKLRSIPWFIATTPGLVVFSSLMIGSVMVLFLDRQGMSKAQNGLLFSLMPFYGLVALFIAPLAARFGYKRAMIVFYGTRKLVMGSLIFAPAVLAAFGFQALFIFVIAVFTIFSFFRAIAETAYYPWEQEFIPNAVRGKTASINNVVGYLAGIVVLAVGGWVMERVAAVLLFLKVPGGAPVREPIRARTHLQGMLDEFKEERIEYVLLALHILQHVS